MAYVLKTTPANRGNYGESRETEKIRYIVIHYTGNDGDSDESAGLYFKNNIVKASAHYFVDDDSVTRSVSDEFIAWSVGGSKYINCDITGGGKWYGICTNANSLSVELCDTNANGKSDFTEETFENGVLLVKKLMKLYRIPEENVIRHFDVTGKACPKPFVDNPEEWELFKERIGKPEYAYAAKSLSLREGIGAFSKKMIQIPFGKKVRILKRETKKYWKIKVTLGGVIYRGYVPRDYLD